MDYNLTHDPEFFKLYKGPKISYSTLRIKDEYYIRSGPILFESGLNKYEVSIIEDNTIPVMFPSTPDSDLPFDIFAAVFYLISRYEEYLDFNKDQYNRFEAAESLAYRNGFLEKPVVDMWICYFYDNLRDKYGKLPALSRSFRYIPTIDIDCLFAYLHKGLIRIAGGLIRTLIDFRLDEFAKRCKVLRGVEGDPFYTVDEIQMIHDACTIHPLYFFLIASHSEFDKGISHRRKAFRQTLLKIKEPGSIGIHPSYRSNFKPWILEKEIETLSDIVGMKIDKSRQHFLQLSLPKTYRSLIRTGIKQDFTMGYASHTGFRAGTCTPFAFYDLIREEETALKLIPFQVMDRTLKDYMGLSPDRAIEKIKELVDSVKSVRGTYVSIWHNDTFSDQGEWKGWEKVYKEMLNYIIKK